jgi:hypothetical protein
MHTGTMTYHNALSEEQDAVFCYESSEYTYPMRIFIFVVNIHIRCEYLYSHKAYKISNLYFLLRMR